ncbi:spermidine/putrescine ABC transporter substrate-binding protein [Planococcus glaciei]|uniref:ABC transporter substrate-binding protein n=1 Tax=Planococcus glaciei TaxID=459472 RepID=A0A7H8Q6X8_9BACL|nr:ABC transporter substrate-binding protein [Planococcus glaciei]ETP68542.1 spermidine/putrescine ABC transporter substrate-binding protein [Planococcus glaciei CHR43]KOF11404.1 spermidine/putrescine ABC transporter substrate-binding protein [Planococcus glaciei]QDY44603.1 ABC transporter substrate-binding protein [Planococcus glaciei]QKX49242.1 ABC transporter substrate-binding protein [Planococcus glaciei]
MKSIIQTSVAILVVCALLFYGVSALEKSSATSGGGSITIYNWGEYIDPELITQFEEETNINVVYETFDSNEAMMTKIEQGGTSYDVAMPSEYAIEKMKENDLLIPIDQEKIPNLKNIDPYFLDLPFDPGNEYSIPYFWGTVGIAFNPTLLEGQTFESWDDLWDPSLEQEVIIVDGAREAIGMGLNSLGYSLNSRDASELREATDKLKTLGPNIKAVIGDEIVEMMRREEAAVALTWSGQAADMMFVNENIDFSVPEEGSNLWFDNMVIPKTSSNVDGAHAFINFMLDAEAAAQNTEYVGYSTPNQAAVALMDPEVTGDERFYPPEELRERLEVYENLGLEMLGIYNELFLEFKMDMEN